MNEEEVRKLLYDLSIMLMENERREAEAVQGYSEQVKLIERVREAAGQSEYSEFLNQLEAATKEKISDELNHVESLYAEYVEMTGIQPAED